MNKSNTGIIILFSVLIVFIIALVVVLAIPMPYTATEEYTAKEPYTETYSEQEPYTTSECKQVNILYNIDYYGIESNCIDTDCARYSRQCAQYKQVCERYGEYCVEKNFWGNCIKYEQRCVDYGQECVRYEDYCVSTECTKMKKTCGIKIYNKERYGGSFTLKLYEWNYDEREQKLVKTETVYVEGLDTKYIYWNYNYKKGESMGCLYNVDKAPTRSECKDVIKYKTVQKTKQGTKNIQKTRTVTKHATLIAQWTGQVEWYYKV